MSQLLNSLPGGFKVDVELRWVPAHLLNSRMKLHAQADFLASNARRTRQHFHKVGRSRMPFFPSVIELIKDFPMVAESGPDRPSEFVVVRQGADVAARRAADTWGELHQVAMRQFHLERDDVLALGEKTKSMNEKLEIALKQTETARAKAEANGAKAETDIAKAEADSARAMTAEKAHEGMKKLLEAALKQVRDTASAQRDAVAETKDDHRASLQLVQEHMEVALGHVKMDLSLREMDLSLRGRDLDCREAEIELKRMLVLARVRGALMLSR